MTTIQNFCSNKSNMKLNFRQSTKRRKEEFKLKARKLLSLKVQITKIERSIRPKLKMVNTSIIICCCLMKWWSSLSTLTMTTEELDLILRDLTVVRLYSMRVRETNKWILKYMDHYLMGQMLHHLTHHNIRRFTKSLKRKDMRLYLSRLIRQHRNQRVRNPVGLLRKEILNIVPFWHLPWLKLVKMYRNLQPLNMMNLVFVHLVWVVLRHNRQLLKYHQIVICKTRKLSLQTKGWRRN